MLAEHQKKKAKKNSKSYNRKFYSFYRDRVYHLNLKKLKVILSGGGTGGHIFPAIAIANEIKKMVPQVEILFVGALGKMEMEKVPAAGYKIIGVKIAGLQRRLTFSNLKLPFLIIQSLLKTRQIIKDFQPDVVVGTGGYASGPVL